MAGQVIPDVCGGAWIPDSGGGEGESLPPGVQKELENHSQKVLVISGVLTWIQAQIGTFEIWKSLAESCFLDGEITAAKEV